MDCRTDLEKKIHGELLERIVNRRNYFSTTNSVDYQLLAQLEAKSKGMPYCAVERHNVPDDNGLPTEQCFTYFCFTPPFYDRSQLYQPYGHFEGSCECGCESMPY